MNKVTPYFLAALLALPLVTVAADLSVEEELKQIKERLAKAEKQLGKASTGSTEISGYASVHYNNLENQLPGGSDLEQIDAHRAVIEVEHWFNKNARIEIELEVEHGLVEDNNDAASSTTSPGELEVENLFAEFTHGDSKIKMGQFVLPVGILNKKHKPTAFYGVERNPVESKIIPTTWWEPGVLYHTKLADNLTVDLAVTAGLNTSVGNNYAIRNGRQKGAEAQATNLAYLATFKWQANDSLKLGASVQHQTDVTQSNDPTAGSANLFTAHADWKISKFGLRALYATWDLEGTGPKAIGADEQTGWYVEPTFRINKAWGLFARHSVWDNQASDSIDTEFSQSNVGVNYWPLKNVVVKFDYQDQDAPTGSNEMDGFNLGMGFHF